jgi:predicted dehydrogenase
VAVIGAGGRGGAALEGTKDENIVAICDVDSVRADAGLKNFKERFPAEAGRHEGAARFDDFRKLFDKMGNKIDAVTISTPDHIALPRGHGRHEAGQTCLRGKAVVAHGLGGA